MPLFTSCSISFIIPFLALWYLVVISLFVLKRLPRFVYEYVRLSFRRTSSPFSFQRFSVCPRTLDFSFSCIYSHRHLWFGALFPFLFLAFLGFTIWSFTDVSLHCSPVLSILHPHPPTPIITSSPPQLPRYPHPHSPHHNTPLAQSRHSILFSRMCTYFGSHIFSFSFSALGFLVFGVSR